MTPSAKKILFFSPYGVFAPHTTREKVLIQRLIHRGYEIVNITCDQVFNICDYKIECDRCYSISKTNLFDANFSVKWLNRYTSPDDETKSRAWVESLQPEQYPAATFEGLQIGDWVRSSVHFMLRVSKLDFSNPLTVKTYRDFLTSGCAFVFAAHRILNEEKYSQVVIMNGRFFSHRIFLEIAKIKGLPVVTHEYGHYFQTIQLQFDRIANSYNNLWTKWQQDSRLPLKLQSLAHVHQIILDRRFRRRASFSFFSPLPKKQKKAADSNTRKNVLCLLSSEYEFNASPDYPHIIGTQTDWMRSLATEMEKYSNHNFIIKLHPNSEDSIVNDIRQIFSEKKISASYEILWPGASESTYDLIDDADYILVFWSTAGIEAACYSKKVFCVTHCVYYGAAFLTSLTAKEKHADELRSFLLDLNPTQDIQLKAYRFSYRYFIEQSVPFTSISNPRDGVSMYNQPIEFYATASTLPQDPYLDYFVDCMEKKEFPDTTKINGDSLDQSGIEEKFFFKCLSAIREQDDISFPKKKVLFLHSQSTPESANHCFENANRLSLFHHSEPLNWLAMLLLMDGHQVYYINPHDQQLLSQWAHEYGAFSGVYSINTVLKSKILFRFVSELALRSPLLTKMGRKFLFALGKILGKRPGSLLGQFNQWFEPHQTFVESKIWEDDEVRKLGPFGKISLLSEQDSKWKLSAEVLKDESICFDETFKSFSLTSENLDALMNSANFDEQMKQIFSALRLQMR